MSKKLLALVAFALLNSAQAAPLIINGGFETGNFSGWSVGISPDFANGGRPYFVDPNGDGWVVASTPQTAYGIPAINNFTAFNGFDGGVVNQSGAPVLEADLRFLLTQTIAISHANDSAVLSFDFRTAGSQQTSYASRGTLVEARTFNVKLVDVQKGAVGSFYTYTLPYNRGDIYPLQHVSLDVSEFLNSLAAPGDVTVLFEEIVPQYFTGGGGFALDNVALDVRFNSHLLGASAVPEPGMLMLISLGLIGLGLSTRRRQ